jgi:hypothetical protein
MNKEKIDCILNIYDDEIFNVLPIIGNIFDMSNIPLNIIKCNILCRSCKHLKLNNYMNWDSISNIFKRYNALKFINNTNMPDYADMYITTSYVPSHIVRRQYNKYIFFCYDEKQLINIIDNIHFFDNIIFSQDEKNIKNILLENKLIINHTFETNRHCIKNILKYYTDNIQHVHNRHILEILNNDIIKIFNELLLLNKCKKIIDLTCNNIKLLTSQIEHYHCNNMNKDILQKIKFEKTQAKITLSNNNISDKKFTELISPLCEPHNTIILVHNIFQYMPFEEIINTIQNLCTLNFTYISFISTQTIANINGEWIDINTNKNDISHGGYRAINLNNMPYNIAIPYKIFYNSQHITHDGNYREEEYVHIYTHREFIKLSKIDNSFTEHPFIKYNYKKKSVNNEYIIYKLKNIDKMRDNIYNKIATYQISN